MPSGLRQRRLLLLKDLVLSLLSPAGLVIDLVSVQHRLGSRHGFHLLL